MADNRDIQNLGGRPPVFDNPEDMQEAIDKYFQHVKGEFKWVDVIDESGKPAKVKEWIREPEPITITGLCLFLGFESRQSFYDYEKRKEFSYIVKKARLNVEKHYEMSAQFAKSPAFHIFALKNMGWSDKQEIQHTGEMTNIINLGSGVKPEE